jgi:hypothetical protein
MRFTVDPTGTIETWASGICAFTQTVERPLSWNSVEPDENAAPCRTPRSETTPSIGENTVDATGVFRVVSMARFVASGTPSTMSRCRAASRKPFVLSALESRSARYSCSASRHCGAMTSARACPRLTRSSGALTYSRMT